MSKVLTASSDVKCGHAGTVGVSGVSKLTVAGNPVLLATGIERKTITGCTIPTVAPPPPPPTTHPCVTAGSISAGKAQKLTVNGQPVILDTLAGSTVGCIPPAGTPPRALQATAKQSKLTAV